MARRKPARYFSKLRSGTEFLGESRGTSGRREFASRSRCYLSQKNWEGLGKTKGVSHHTIRVAREAPCLKRRKVQVSLQRSKNFVTMQRSRRTGISSRQSENHDTTSYLGLPTIALNVFIGSVLVELVRAPSAESWIPTAAMVATFVAAALGGVQTFFNFDRIAEAHRGIANEYIQVARLCKDILRHQCDSPTSAGDLWREYTQLRTTYFAINSKAEACPTSHLDLQRALKIVEKSLTPTKDV